MDLNFLEAVSGVCERGDPGQDKLGLGAMRFLICNRKPRIEAYDGILASLEQLKVALGH